MFVFEQYDRHDWLGAAGERHVPERWLKLSLNRRNWPAQVQQTRKCSLKRASCAALAALAA